MKTNKVMKCRIYPNEEQRILINKTFGCCRFIYNKMLSDKINHYNETGLSLNNTPAQYKDEFKWLKEVDSLALCNAQMNLQSAYNNFFRDKKVGFPKFKSKKKSKKSYTTNIVGNNIRIENSNIVLPKLGLVKIKLHRRFPKDWKLKSVTISQDSAGRYFASLLYEYDFTFPNYQVNPNNSLGLDYSSHDFYVDSQNKRPEQSRYFRRYEDKLAKEQRKLSNMKTGSNNYNKQKIKVGRVHCKILDCRKEFIETLSTKLANEYDIVCVEDIDLQNMSQCLTLGKSTMDNGFGIFRTRLEQKLFERGKKFVKIDKWYPSSKTCRFCGCVNSELTLADRIWTCSCGSIIDRDENAAINIMNEGIRILGF